jgi:branched-chain amino acid transport system permease protein
MFKRMMSVWARHEKIVTLAGVAVAIFFPLLFSRVYILNVGIMCLLYALLSLSLNFITGYAGIVVLGQAAFYGIGAYTFAIVATRFGWGFIPAALAAMCAAFLAGLLIALPTLRVSGKYFSIVTLGFCEIVRIAELNLTGLTGGPFGFKNIPHPTFFGVVLKSARQKYFLILALLTLSVAAVYNIVNSRSGRAFIALKNDEFAAQAMGINTQKQKLLAFGIASCIAGLAGAFFSSYVNYIDSTIFNYNQSIQILSITIMGGLGSISGSIVGAVFFIVLPELLRFLAKYRQIFYGAVLIVMIMFKPDGFLGGINLRQIRLFERLHGKKAGEGQ